MKMCIFMVIVVPTNINAIYILKIQEFIHMCIVKIMVTKYDNERFENPHHQIVGKT